MDHAALNSAITQKAQETDFSGVVSISRKGRRICNAAFGFRDRKNSLPNTPETLFGIASGTKLFTALGIGALIAAGKLSLDTRVKELEVRNAGYVDPDATIRQLLNHTSGIFDYLDEEAVEDFDAFRVAIPWSDLQTPSDYFPLFKDQPMKFPPGRRYSYSNGGYVFLGILIEELSGRLHREFMHEHVLAKTLMPN